MVRPEGVSADRTGRRGCACLCQLLVIVLCYWGGQVGSSTLGILFDVGGDSGCILSGFCVIWVFVCVWAWLGKGVGNGERDVAGRSKTGVRSPRPSTPNEQATPEGAPPPREQRGGVQRRHHLRYRQRTAAPA